MNIFQKIDKILLEHNIVIDVVAINQIENGYGEQVESGVMPLITYTYEIRPQNYKLGAMGIWDNNQLVGVIMPARFN